MKFVSDDGTTEGDPIVEKLDQLYREGGKKAGRSFTVVEDDLQRKGIEAAGFTNLHIQTFKVRYRQVQTVSAVKLLTNALKLPVGGWPRDARLAEVGRILQLTMLNDLEGEN